MKKKLNFIVLVFCISVLGSSCAKWGLDKDGVPGPARKYRSSEWYSTVSGSGWKSVKIQYFTDGVEHDDVLGGLGKDYYFFSETDCVHYYRPIEFPKGYSKREGYFDDEFGRYCCKSDRYTILLLTKDSFVWSDISYPQSIYCVRTYERMTEEELEQVRKGYTVDLDMYRKRF